jgi:hypothetical protein
MTGWIINFPNPTRNRTKIKTKTSNGSIPGWDTGKSIFQQVFGLHLGTSYYSQTADGQQTLLIYTLYLAKGLNKGNNLLETFLNPK